MRMHQKNKTTKIKEPNQKRSGSFMNISGLWTTNHGPSLHCCRLGTWLRQGLDCLRASVSERATVSEKDLRISFYNPPDSIPAHAGIFGNLRIGSALIAKITNPVTVCTGIDRLSAARVFRRSRMPAI